MTPDKKSDVNHNCKICKYHSGLAKGQEMNEEKIKELEKTSHADHDHESLWEGVNAKVPWRIFLAVLAIFLGIVGTLLAFQWNDRTDYRQNHAQIHKELNNEIKQMNRELTEKLQRISEDLKVIKAKIENGDR